MNETERLDSLPSGNLRIWQDEKEFSFTTDAVFLAAFPHMVKKPASLSLAVEPALFPFWLQTGEPSPFLPWIKIPMSLSS